MSKVPVKKTAFALSRGQKRPREKASSHLDFIRSLPCCICGAEAEDAHIRMGAPMMGKRETGAAEKPSDKYTVPLCPNHHRNGNASQHVVGERRFWQRLGIDPVIVSALLWQVTGDHEAGSAIVLNVRTLVIWTGGK